MYKFAEKMYKYSIPERNKLRHEKPERQTYGHQENNRG